MVGLLARDGLNRAGEGETRGLDGEECVVATGLHTAGREGDVRDGGGGVECVVAIGLHTAGREGDVRDGGGGVECVVAIGLHTAGRDGDVRDGGGGVECVVAIGLHTAGRDGDVRDGGGGRDATALNGGKSASSWCAGSGETEGGGVCCTGRGFVGRWVGRCSDCCSAFVYQTSGL